MMTELFAMGDYTAFVWSSVGIVCGVLGLIAWRAHSQFKQTKHSIKWEKHVQS